MATEDWMREQSLRLADATLRMSEIIAREAEGLIADATSIKAERDALRERAERAEGAAKSLDTYLCMELSGYVPDGGFLAHPEKAPEAIRERIRIADERATRWREERDALERRVRELEGKPAEGTECETCDRPAVHRDVTRGGTAGGPCCGKSKCCMTKEYGWTTAPLAPATARVAYDLTDEDQLAAFSAAMRLLRERGYVVAKATGKDGK